MKKFIMACLASLLIAPAAIAQCNVDVGSYWGILSCNPPPVTTDHYIQIRGTNWRVFPLTCWGPSSAGFRITNSLCGRYKDDVKTQMFFDGQEAIVPIRPDDCPPGGTSWQMYVDMQYTVTDPIPWLNFSFLEANWNSADQAWDVPNGTAVDWRYLVMSDHPGLTWRQMFDGETINWGRYGVRPRTDGSVYEWYRPVGTAPLLNGGVGNFADCWSQNTNTYVHLSNLRTPQYAEMDTFGATSMYVADVDIFIGTAGMLNYNPADINHDGVVTVQDIFSFLNAYFSNSLQADFNNDELVSMDDLFTFLSIYFAG